MSGFLVFLMCLQLMMTIWPDAGQWAARDVCWDAVGKDVFLLERFVWGHFSPLLGLCSVRWGHDIWPHLVIAECKLAQQRVTTTHLPELSKSRTLTTPNADKDVEQQELVHCSWECEVIQSVWKIVWWFLTKLSILLPYSSAIIESNCANWGKWCYFSKLQTLQ